MSRKKQSAADVEQTRPFFKCYPSNFLSGCIKLTAEEKGVYYTLCMLLYDSWEPIDDGTVKQRQDLARFCGTTTRGFTTIRDRLLAMPEKLKRDADGRLTNARFERERARLTELKNQIDGEKSARKSEINGEINEATPNENKGMLDPPYAAESRVQSLDSTVLAEKGALSEAAEDVIDSEIRRICRAIGVDLQASTKRAAWPYNWTRMRELYDITVEDMVAAIDSYSEQFKGEQVRSLGMFKERAIEKRVARQLNDRLVGRARARTVVDATAVSTEQWTEALTLFINTGAWSPTKGPSPLEPGCLVPESMLINAERYWTAQGNHPKYMHHGGTRVAWEAGKTAPLLQPQAFAPRSKQ